MRIISWPNTDPAHLLSTLSPERYRSGPKTRYEASGAELPRWSFHPLEIMSFSCRTQTLSTRGVRGDSQRRANERRKTRLGPLALAGFHQAGYSQPGSLQWGRVMTKATRRAPAKK